MKKEPRLLLAIIDFNNKKKKTFASLEINL